MVQEKIAQAIQILKEKNIDLWLTFVRESHTLTDPCLPLILGAHCTWQSAFMISSTGETVAIVGNLDFQNIKDTNTYQKVISYKASIRDALIDALKQLHPKTIALNFSKNDHMADGLTVGMYQLLQEYLKGTPYAKRLISAEEIIAALRGRKSPAEIARLKKAIQMTVAIFDKVTQFAIPGKSEQEIAQFILNEVAQSGFELAWDATHCPAVFTGPDTAGAHYGPTNRKIEPGHVMNIDFGLKIDDYVSDLQRTWYFLQPGEREAPATVQKAFATVRDAISAAAEFLKPGVTGWQVDQVARQYIVAQGYEEYPHALGHQVGRAAHDGAGTLCPRWERYGNLPYLRVEAGQVYTLEPRVTCEGHGVVTIEEEVVVTENGCEFLSPRQRELYVIG
ncbi:MAG: Xaa-Pro peptidase family protein [candidate division KSB1 bacterium]|nr:Xaa-Pro peptidase family protein [candidate division KSB1 bacterium]MDZ7318793.1 Xaa-Pro peptidase family protein [candidate division KSB1 bacterium]MDZ7342401.1 Xaa-Pro peptidase family protein [candidate division KSB1 bacterium]